METSTELGKKHEVDIDAPLRTVKLFGKTSGSNVITGTWAKVGNNLPEFKNRCLCV